MADELLTPHLRLRRWNRDDRAALCEIFGQPEVWRFPFGRGLTPEETGAFLAHRIAEQATGAWCEWAAERREDRKLIGYIGLARPYFLPEVMPTVEIGWRLDPSSWGRGLATEGAKAALADGFTHPDLDEVVSIYQPENEASGRVMARLGMRFDRDTHHPTRGLALRVYRLSRVDWLRTSRQADSSG
jgi:RimJ/RimL family protein N-acetyltransferase